jgi:UDP-N-acetylglucosamine 2-epimerase
LCQIEPEKFNNIRFIEPLSYLDFLTLMQASEMILTDSGGIQKEAYIIGKLCITLRPETEWIETVKTGWNILLPPQSKEFPEKILSVSKPSIHPPLFGSEVSQKILSVLEQA